MGTHQRPMKTVNPFILEMWTGVRPAWEWPWWSLAERVLGLRRLAELYASLAARTPTADAFAEAALKDLKVNWPEMLEFGLALRQLKGPLCWW